MQTKTRIYTGPAGLKHDTGPGHPEQIARLESVMSLFEEPPLNILPVIAAHPAEEDWLALAHDRHYIDTVRDAIPEDGHAYLDGDTVVCPDSWQAALEAAGALCQAVQDVTAGVCTRAFCAVRPPGHHAVPDKAMGFCLFNNIFIGTRYAQEECGTGKVAIVDFDVHHGNGTDAMTRRADDILFISSHQFPFYPGTGDPRYDEPGKVLNIPLPAGTGSAEFRSAYEREAFPALESFAPDLMMISAGFDAHRDDPLGGMNLTEDDFFWVTKELCGLADRLCGGKTIAALEGGYNLEALKSSVAAHLRALTDL